ncbi:MAG: hypothetical protein LUH58_04115 [Lachnospiraceae bacterium]|nr:hypothetical protein [Lachnospiraceae bacterium]
MVALSDGYYNVNLTWDDSVTVAYTYFNIPDSVFSQTHTRTGLSTQLPACTATEYYNPEMAKNFVVSSIFQRSRFVHLYQENKILCSV